MKHNSSFSPPYESLQALCGPTLHNKSTITREKKNIDFSNGLRYGMVCV